MWTAWASGDRRAAREQFPNVIFDELVVWGSPSECRTRLRDLERAAGIRVIATYFGPPGADYLDVAIPADRAEGALTA